MVGDNRTPEEQAEDAARLFCELGSMRPGTYGARLRLRAGRLVKFIDLRAPLWIVEREVDLVNRAMNEVKNRDSLDAEIPGD